ncbi:MAG: Chromosome partition protein Smc [Chlamydiae bacterium]|nr:Chromosome partition protein Smc [Chlamydiota bacterium]
MTLKIISKNLKIYDPSTVGQQVDFLEMNLSRASVANYFSINENQLLKIHNIEQDLIVSGTLFQKSLQIYKEEFSPKLAQDIKLGMVFCDQTFPIHKATFLQVVAAETIDCEDLQRTLKEINSVFEKMRSVFEIQQKKMVEFRESFNKFSLGIGGVGVNVRGRCRVLSKGIKLLTDQWDKRGAKYLQIQNLLFVQSTEIAERKNWIYTLDFKLDNLLIKLRNSKNRLDSLGSLIGDKQNQATNLRKAYDRSVAEKQNTNQRLKKETNLLSIFAVGLEGFLDSSISKAALKKFTEAKNRLDSLKREKAHLPLEIERLEKEIKNSHTRKQEIQTQLDKMHQLRGQANDRASRLSADLLELQQKFIHHNGNLEKLKKMVPNENFVHIVQTLNEFISTKFSTMFGELDTDLKLMNSSLSLEKKLLDRSKISILKRGFEIIERSVGEFRKFCVKNGGTIKTTPHPQSRKSILPRQRRTSAMQLPSIKPLTYKARGLIRNGKFLEALCIREQILDLIKAIHSSDHKDIVAALNLIGAVHMKMKCYKKATKYGFKALEMNIRLYPEGDKSIALSCKNLAKAYRLNGDDEQGKIYESLGIKMQKQQEQIENKITL